MLCEQVAALFNKSLTTSLNPCSNGRCSARDLYNVEGYKDMLVLIRVLMEDALRDLTSNPYHYAPIQS